jgi:hypothetical protein
MTLRPSRKQSQRQPVIALAPASYPGRQGSRLCDGWLFRYHANSQKPKTGRVLLRARRPQNRNRLRPALRQQDGGDEVKRKRNIQDEGGFVTLDVTLPPHLLRWATKRAKDQGHGDIQVVVREAIGLLVAKHTAQSPAA